MTEIHKLKAFIFNNEPTGAYRFMDLFMMRTDEQTVHHSFHVQHRSDSGGHYKQYARAG